eukprot:CAMPEP_0175057656 /NCGR_PEP_ID=MMETSP0052_2-20121109/11383_1 /TAXON_ID=51329 ORGANISM="Polytomella parva, Strain SAG 63-3" /NCGR_SAMPLE_ID=MMETSP0052_2 /ASSEMBLY_ACC=CAM_ASM_000194 /LENGTH=208 /DNA_ID=CAMNT_0016322889 /DNA_START=179 /DNA_END=806 /DNA_ORIENTATION=+
MDLQVSLEDLLQGCKKKLKVTRHVLDRATQAKVSVQEVLEVDIKPGWKAGTRVTFEGKGDERVSGQADDLVFVVREQKHDVFTRDGNDLIQTIKIPLVTALTGGTVTAKKLGGRDEVIRLSEVVEPGKEITLKGLGMPLSKSTTGARGDMKVRFDVMFPKKLTEAAKTQIREILLAAKRSREREGGREGNEENMEREDGGGWYVGAGE